MGRIRASFSHFLDLASEEVACSSGVLLSDANIRRLAGRYRISELRGITRTSGETVLRAEELEEAILSLRVAIGELPDNKMGQFFLVDAARVIWATGGNPRKLAAAFLAIADSGRYQSLTNEAIDEIAKMSGQRIEHISRSLMPGASSVAGRINSAITGRTKRGTGSSSSIGSLRESTSPTIRPCTWISGTSTTSRRMARRCPGCTGATSSGSPRNFSGGKNTRLISGQERTTAA